MAMQSGPYYSNLLGRSDERSLGDTRHGQYPDLDPSMAPNAHIYSLADGALQVHQNTTDRQFAGLIEAATAAAGQESSYTQDGDFVTPRRTTRRTRANMNEVPPTTLFAQSYPGNDTLISSSRKRKRQSHSDGLQRTPLPSATDASTPDDGQISMLELGPGGHSPAKQSAAALFRNPSASSKKYTRPPMSKLFTSLELGPENFLHLQAAAKAYMLNPDHPERVDCVGQRGKGDSELVKMRLWNCVAYFLDEEGHGQAHFGVSIPGDEGLTRSMIWPRDRSRIIGAVIPLLRRMVTNERQRQYAVESRKGGSAGNGRKKESDSKLHSPVQQNGDQDVEDQADPGISRVNEPLYAPEDHGQLTMPSTHSSVGMHHHHNSIRLHISIIEDRRRIRPTYEALAEQCPELQAIYAQVLQHYSDVAVARATVSVLLPQGLTSVYSDEQWVKALSTVQETDWMDGETKVVVDLG